MTFFYKDILTKNKEAAERKFGGFFYSLSEAGLFQHQASCLLAGAH